MPFRIHLQKLKLPLLLLALVAWLPGCKQETGHYRLTYSVFFPSVHVQCRLAEHWAREIEARTNGRVSIIVYPGGVLSGASENYDCVVHGVSDIGMSCLAYSRGLFPLCECLDLPLGYPDGATATRVANQFVEKFQPADFHETKLMYLHAHGPGVLATVCPISKLNQLEGMNIRGTGVTAQVIRQLGGNAVGLAQGDTFEALYKGVVKGTLCPVETLKGWKQSDVIQQVTKIPAIGYSTVMFVTMNKNTWNKLPRDIQEVILQVNKEWIPKHGEAWDKADQGGRFLLRELKKEMTEFSPEENEKTAQRIRPMLTRWAENADQKGLPGTEAIQFIQTQINRK